jgi:hypothetical protein
MMYLLQQVTNTKIDWPSSLVTLERDNRVLSDTIITGAMVAPDGKCSFI